MPDREKVIKALENCKEGGSCDGCSYDTNTSKCIFRLHEDALALLKDHPQIVRCRDCKHQYFVCKSGNVICGHVQHESETHGADWFCADGERK